MTAEELENLSLLIALKLVPQIKMGGTPEEMNQSAEAWVSRSRNLAKLWVARAPTKAQNAFDAIDTLVGAMTAHHDLLDEEEPTLEELGQQNASEDEQLVAQHLQQQARRKRK
jgi:hypothetical protein